MDEESRSTLHAGSAAAGRVVALLLLLAVPVAARAQAPMRPTAAQWTAAEVVVRAHYDAAHRPIVELTRMRQPMGTTFWVRCADGGELAAVRDGAVLPGRGEALVSAILRNDDALHAHTWSAATLLALWKTLTLPLPLAHDAIDATHGRATAPRLVYTRDAATLVLYAFRTGPPEAPARPRLYLQRATGVIDASYAIHWTVEDVILETNGRQFWPSAPDVYDACFACAGDPTKCGACLNASCLQCFVDAVVTDPSFCRPHCR